MSETVSLKEYFERILEEKDKAINIALAAAKESVIKAENAAEKRFELLNELRQGVATKDQLGALEKVVDELKTSKDKSDGKGIGLNQGWVILIGLVGLIGGIVALVSKLP